MQTKKIKNTRFLKLKYYRQKYEVKQESMALLIGCGTPNYCHKENGKIPFTFPECCIVMDALNKHARKNGDEILTLNDIFLD